MGRLIWLKLDIYRPEEYINIHFLKMKGRRVKQVFSGVGTSERWVGTRKGWMRVNMMDVFCIRIWKQKNETCIPVKIALRKGEGGRGRTMEGVNLRYVVSTYVNIIMYPPIQLLYANKNFLNKKYSGWG
jgi:hypothetical protein